MKKVIITLIACLVVIMVGLGVVLGVGIAGGYDGGLFGSHPLAELVNRQAFAADDVKKLQMDYSSDSITLLPATGDEIVLEEYMSHAEAKNLATTLLKDGTLSIAQGERQFFQIGFWSSYIYLYVPAQWLGEVELVTSSGGIHTDTNWHFKSLQATSTSGSVRLAGLEADTKALLQSSSGGVSAGDVKTGNGFTAGSTSGSVRFAGIEAGGDVSLIASSGGVSADSCKTPGVFYAASTSGSVRLGAVEATTITASSGSGTVQFESAAADAIEMESGSGNVQAGTLTGSFTLKTVSGGVMVEHATGGGRATSGSGSVKMAMDGLEENLWLQSSSGSVKLVLPQKASFTFSAKTVSGSINTPFNDKLSFNQSGNEASGTVGENARLQVNCEAGSGSVYVE